MDPLVFSPVLQNVNSFAANATDGHIAQPEKYAASQLPFYTAVQCVGTYKFMAIPLLTVNNSCKIQMRCLEHQLHLRWMPRGNAPWVHKYVGSKCDGDIIELDQQFWSGVLL